MQYRAGITVRRVDGEAGERIRKKQTLVCNGPDRVWNMAQRESRKATASAKACLRPEGVSLRENLENLWRWESKRQPT
jgi:hypothetical protein